MPAVLVMVLPWVLVQEWLRVYLAPVVVVVLVVVVPPPIENRLLLFVDKFDLADEGKSLPTARDATLDMGYVDVVENITLMIEFVHEQ